jgi:hypothetical protein
MRLVKVLVILGAGFYFGVQGEWRDAILAKYGSFVERWAGLSRLALPTEGDPPVGPSSTN